MWHLRDFYFTDQDGRKSSDYHMIFENYPMIQMGQRQYDSVVIPGRGTLLSDTDTYSDTIITFTIDVNVMMSADARIKAYLDARRILVDLKTISFCDSPEYFYRVKTVSVGAVGQYSEIAGDFEVQLICEPAVYLQAGTKQYDAAEAADNPYSVCRPLYRITGEGVCTLTVNGKTMSANIAQNLTIDTGRMLAYRTDGTLQNTAVTGRYEDLYLQPGKNTIAVTAGFSLKVIPNWGYLL